METRIAHIGILIEEQADVSKVNAILSEFSEYIVARMGVPYREKNVNIISVVIDAPQDKISSLSGKLGMVKDVSSKTLYTKR